MKPTKYDMNKKADVERWFREMESYLKCGEESRKDFVYQGTDFPGRKFALDGFYQLRQIMRDGK